MRAGSVPVHAGNKRLQFALVSDSLRSKPRLKWGFQLQRSGAILEETSVDGFIVQFKDDHRCAFQSPGRQGALSLKSVREEIPPQVRQQVYAGATRRFSTL